MTNLNVQGLRILTEEDSRNSGLLIKHMVGRALTGLSPVTIDGHEYFLLVMQMDPLKKDKVTTEQIFTDPEIKREILIHLIWNGGRETKQFDRVFDSGCEAVEFAARLTNSNEPLTTDWMEQAGFELTD